MTWHPDWWRPRIFVVIASSFFFMTFFVYSNYPDRGIHKKLSPDAKQGLALWQRNNCQVCHQIYGFGGFLGPDLTNIMARRPDEDWTEILTVGRKQMPAFHFNEGDRTAILAYLRAVDETGQSIPEFTSLKEGVDHGHLVKAYLDDTGRTAPVAVLRGETEVRENGCHSCHRTFARGLKGSPDISLSLSRRSRDYIRTLLKKGKGSMPEFEYLTGDKVEDILSYVAWINQNRRPLGLYYSKKENGETFSWSHVPWFEY